MPGVRVPGANLPDLWSRAQACADRYARTAGHYDGGNSPLMHRIGKLGEWAATSYFTDWGLPVRALWKDPTQEAGCDLIVGDVRVDVKTCSLPSWPRLGGCVAVAQVPFLRQKCDVLLWARLLDYVPEGPPDRAPDVWTWLHGWSWLADVLATPVRDTPTNDGRSRPNHRVDPDQTPTCAQLVDLVGDQLGQVPVHRFDRLIQESTCR